MKNQLGIASLPDQLCPLPQTCVPVVRGNDQRLYINYLSGSGGSFPYFVASGKSGPSTGGTLLLTGMTTITNPNTDPDFPRVGCLLGMCSIALIVQPCSHLPS
ncbi:MAG TPA: hypothetical protein VHZ07_06655 [Bryobacteraceae bacterium]|nr:hypothetical protein [Bryobacteraceae bacterium]